MDLLSTDMNSMLNSVSSWWGSGNASAKSDSSPPTGPSPRDETEKPADVCKSGTDACDIPESGSTKEAGDAPSETSPKEGKETNAENSTEPLSDIDLEEMSQKAVSTAKEWGSYLLTVGKTATLQVTDQVTKTAKQLKDTIDDKTIVGDFNKLQTRFVSDNQDKKKKSEAAVPPWVGYNEEQAMKSQILALSSDKRNFLRNPPAGVQFNFEFEASFPVAMAMLQEDLKLKKMRFDLVPKQVKEDVFWRNYFYRVSLIKQSAQLTSLAQNTGNTSESPGRPGSADSQTEHVKVTKSTSKEEEKEAEEFNPGSPPDHEFVSDSFQESQISEDDLKKEMQQLGMSDKEEDIPEWERELQAELQEYEVVNDGSGLDGDDALEQEILDQLQAESTGSGSEQA